MLFRSYLHVNVVSDFRMRKNNPYYSTDGTRSVEGMKIIPLQTSEIKTIIEKGLTYRQLYALFDTAFYSDKAPREWYRENIVGSI